MPYSPCTGDCPFRSQRRVASTTTADGPSLALAAETRTRPFAGVLALGLELTAFLGKGASSVGLSVPMDVGRL